MTTAFAWIDGSKATKAERTWAAANAPFSATEPPKTPTKGQLFGVLHQDGGDGRLYVWVDIPKTSDYAENYRIALDALLKADKRIRNGHAFSIGII